LSLNIEDLTQLVESSHTGFVFIRSVNGFRSAICGVEPSGVYSFGGGSKPSDSWDNCAERLRSLVKRHLLLMGYASFSATAYWEDVPFQSSSPFKDMEFAGYDSFLRLDRQGSAWRVGADKNYVFDHTSSRGRPDVAAELLSESLGLHEYSAAVNAAKQYIRAGDIFQVVLARRLELSVKGDISSIFLRLVQTNPSPYMYYLKFRERRILGSSPESLFKVQGRKVETYPIAGTRPVTGDKLRDQAFRTELLRNKKEAAEHVMLVDLARNDLGKVSELGSVRVPIYRRVVAYSHVQHLVSKVTGRLQSGIDAFDVFKAVFPAGTVSGAPKVRAIQIIDELERAPRGPYAGAVGFFDGSGNADFAINIRSMHSFGEMCHVGVGAGIVAGSDPHYEYLETQSKAAAMLSVLGLNRALIQK
jgi:anthranilate synthase component 1